VCHFITKAEYFAALDDRKTMKRLRRTRRLGADLKHVQDAWVLTRLRDAKGLRILEIGGADARTLNTIAGGNEIWNLDDFGETGTNRRKREVPKTKKVKVVPAKLGSFAKELPEGHFDIIVSISVVEHVPYDAYPDFWRDHVRVMKPKGLALHAVDFYLGEEADPVAEKRLDQLLSAWREAGLAPDEESPIARPVVFRPNYASNPDFGMWRWNRAAPTLAARRAVAQSVSLAVTLRRA
jgi:hypothetical protein